MNTPKSLWTSFVKENWPYYVLGMFCVAFTAVTQILSPMLIGWGIDFFKGVEIPSFLTQSSKRETFQYIFILLVCNIAIMNCLRSGWRITLGRMTHKATAFYKKKLWASARYFSRNDLDTEYTIGNLMNLSTSDVGMVRFLHGFTLIGLFDVIFLGLFSIGAMFYINWQMALVVMFIVPTLPVFIYRLAKVEMERWEQTQKFLSKFNEQVSRAVETVKLQRLTQTGAFWRRRLETAANDYRMKRLASIFTSFRYYPTVGSGTLFSYVVLFGMGIQQVYAGNITIGEFVAFQSFVFLLQEPLMEAGFIVSELQKGRTSFGRLADVFNNPADPNIKMDGLSEADSDLVFRVNKLGYSYENQEVLKDVNIEVNRGERLGILGPIGSGKSTLVEILIGLRKDYQGDVELLGKDIRSFSHNYLRNEFVMVQQKSFLFADNIRNNIKLEMDLSDEEVWQALDLACLSEDVKTFEEGLDTQLGEWGVNLSGGQKQRLTLARALVRKPKYLLLDDCLSAVDTVTEETILKNLDHNLKESTLVWVAHRRSTLKYCDQILELGHE